MFCLKEVAKEQKKNVMLPYSLADNSGRICGNTPFVVDGPISPRGRAS